jgi:DNA-binding GntR family transcriptional regulator
MVTVYDALRSMVMSGDVRDDTRVAESQLAEQLGVSRTPVREALQRLEGDGLVVAQGRGIRVRLLSTDELSQLYSARAGLEGWAAYRAAQRVEGGEIPPARLAELNALAAETHRLTTSGELARAVEANRSFHEAVAMLAENPVITSTLGHWWDQIVVSTRRSLQKPERTRAVQSEHKVILRALRYGDAFATRAAVESHVLATRDALNDNQSETETRA